MDNKRITQCEEDYLTESKRLDELEGEFAEEWVRTRSVTEYSDWQTTKVVTAELKPYFNLQRAKVHIARVRLERAWLEQGE